MPGRIALVVAMVSWSACHGADELRSSEGVAKVPVRRIWDASRIDDPRRTRMELTDLIRFKDYWYCSFREAADHNNHPTGTGRIIRSRDGETWESAALFQWQGADVREPGLCITAEGALMAHTSIYFVTEKPNKLGRYYQLENPVGLPNSDAETGVVRQSVTWFTTDGTTWSTAYACPTGINNWRWSVTWFNGMGYSLAHPGLGGKDVTGTLYRTRDGKTWRPLLEGVWPPEALGNEAALNFDSDGTAACLLRASNTPTWGGTLIGTSLGPYYQRWRWQTPQVDWQNDGTLKPAPEVFRVGLGGPRLLRLKDGRLIGAGRMATHGVEEGHIALFWVNPKKAVMTRFAEVAGTSYTGIAEHDGELWITCGSGTADGIYLGKLKIPEKTDGR